MFSVYWILIPSSWAQHQLFTQDNILFIDIFITKYLFKRICILFNWINLYIVWCESPIKKEHLGPFTSFMIYFYYYKRLVNQNIRHGVVKSSVISRGNRKKHEFIWRGQWVAVIILKNIKIIHRMIRKFETKGSEKDFSFCSAPQKNTETSWVNEWMNAWMNESVSRSVFRVTPVGRSKRKEMNTSIKIYVAILTFINNYLSLHTNYYELLLLAFVYY